MRQSHWLIVNAPFPTKGACCYILCSEMIKLPPGAATHAATSACAPYPAPPPTQPALSPTQQTLPAECPSQEAPLSTPIGSRSRLDHTFHRQIPPPHLRVRSSPPPFSRRTHQPGGASSTETAPPARRRVLTWDQGIREKFTELHLHHLLPSIFGSPRCF